MVVSVPLRGSQLQSFSDVIANDPEIAKVSVPLRGSQLQSITAQVMDSYLDLVSVPLRGSQLQSLSPEILV